MIDTQAIRSKLLDLAIRQPAVDAITITRFPESTLAVYHDMAEIVVVTFGITLQFLCLQRLRVQSEQSVAGCTNKQLFFVFLNNMIDTRQGFGTFQCDMLKLVVVTVITVQSQLRTYPEVIIGI